MAFTKILPAGISTTGTVTVDSLSVGDVTLTGDTDNLIINTDTVTVRPTLDLNFARDKRLDSKITFTRNSVGTYVDANGLIQTAVNNIPRFDHDPITGESLGLLIEESRTNLITYSEDLSNAAWTKGAANVQTNAITSPAGDSTADKLYDDNTSGTHHYVTQSFNKTATTYTASVYVKAAEYTKIALGFSGVSNWQGSPQAQYNLSTGTTIIVGADTTATINSVGNGWYRLTLTSTSLNTTASAFSLAHISDSGTNTGAGSVFLGHGGDGSSGVYIWGAQVEQGSFPTSYIPTSGSTVTRAADLAKITGTNFTDFYNQTEGTIFFNYKNLSTDTSTIRGVWGLENSAGPVSGIRSPQSGATRIRLLYNNNFSSASSNLFLIDTNYKKGVVAYNQTENRLMMNGTSDFVSATHTNDNTIVALSIGSRTINGDSPLGGHIKYFKYYNKRLSNAQLQNLTK